MARHAIPMAPALVAAMISTGLAGCATLPAAPPTVAVEVVPALPMGSPLLMDDAVRHALATDPSVRVARHRVSAAYWETLQAALPANPTVGVSLDSNWSASLGSLVSNWLDFGGQRSYRVAAAQSREEQAALDAMRLEAAVAHRVQSAFAEVVARRRMEALYTERLALLEQVLDIERLRQAWGDLSELALIDLERQWVLARVAPEDEALLRRQAEARLNRSLGLPLREWLELGAPWDTEDDWPNLAGRDELDLGMVRRPELAMLAAQLVEHEAEMRLAKIAWLPDVEAGPVLEWPRGDGAAYGGGFVSVTIPVFDHGQARRRAAHEHLLALEQAMLAAQAEVLLEVHEALLRVQRAQVRVGSDWREEQDRATRQREMTEQLASAGAASRVDALMSRVHELNARIALEDARKELWQARIDLIAALGNPMAVCHDSPMNGWSAHGKP